MTGDVILLVWTWKRRLTRIKLKFLMYVSRLLINLLISKKRGQSLTSKWKFDASIIRNLILINPYLRRGAI